MKFNLLALTLLITGLSFIQAQEPALKELPLPAAKATIQIPEGWHVREDNEEGVIVYQITREQISPETGTFLVGFTLSITPDVPGRAQMTPSQYARELLSFSVEDGGTIVENKNDALTTFRTEYSIEGEGGTMQIVDLATANDTTGTLYFIAWQAPDSESEALKPLREKILSSLQTAKDF